MDDRKISPDLTVSPQIVPGDLRALAEEGYRSVIINRPDGEGEGQPDAAEIEAAAESLGLKVRYIPVTPGQITDDNVAAFGRALAELPSPTLAYCRTGTRSVSLWALSEAGRLSPDEIIERAAKAGYDLENLRRRLEAEHQRAADGLAAP
jgi:sulfide:quinone oxidoreductase